MNAAMGELTQSADAGRPSCFTVFKKGRDDYHCAVAEVHLGGPSPP